MLIYDLTQGKYNHCFNDVKTLEKQSEANIRHVFPPYYSKFLFIHTKRAECTTAPMQLLFNTTPIFLVDTTMVGNHLFVDEGGYYVHVPGDKSSSLCDDEELDIDEWVKSKEDTSESEYSQVTIADLLGVYVQDDALVQKKIFIWLDKIENYAKKHSQKEEDIKGNAQSLLNLVLFHELGHALMDVELYGETPSPKFSYRNDHVYKYIEEAYANCIALTCLYWDVIEEVHINRDDHGYSFKNHFSSPKVSFIKNFVLGQGAGYSVGWELFERFSYYLYSIEQWMCVKILFDYELACCLRNFWKSKNFSNIDYVKQVGRDKWFLLKDHFNKYKVMDINTRRWVSCFNRYDYFWSFDEKGLSIVKEDGFWGCIDENGDELVPCIYDWIDSFKNGVSIAKKGELYGAIDKYNHIVIPFKYSRKEAEGLLKRLH